MRRLDVGFRYDTIPRRNEAGNHLHSTGGAYRVSLKVCLPTGFET
jgi:hypothetical protein